MYDVALTSSDIIKNNRCDFNIVIVQTGRSCLSTCCTSPVPLHLHTGHRISLLITTVHAACAGVHVHTM